MWVKSNRTRLSLQAFSEANRRSRDKSSGSRRLPAHWTATDLQFPGPRLRLLNSPTGEQALQSIAEIARAARAAHELRGVRQGDVGTCPPIRRFLRRGRVREGLASYGPSRKRTDEPAEARMTHFVVAPRGTWIPVCPIGRPWQWGREPQQEPSCFRPLP
jgi:hypothetical protein